MKRLHLTMLLVVLVCAAIFLGHLFGGGQRGALIGASAAAVVAGALLWKIAPAEYRRQLRIIERRGMTLDNPDEFRSRFLKGARTPAVILIILGLVALVYLLATQ